MSRLATFSTSPQHRAYCPPRAPTPHPLVKHTARAIFKPTPLRILQPTPIRPTGVSCTTFANVTSALDRFHAYADDLPSSLANPVSRRIAGLHDDWFTDDSSNSPSRPFWRSPQKYDPSRHRWNPFWAVKSGSVEFLLDFLVLKRANFDIQHTVEELARLVNCAEGETVYHNLMHQDEEKIIKSYRAEGFEDLYDSEGVLNLLAPRTIAESPEEKSAPDCGCAALNVNDHKCLLPDLDLRSETEVENTVPKNLASFEQNIDIFFTFAVPADYTESPNAVLLAEIDDNRPRCVVPDADVFSATAEEDPKPSSSAFKANLNICSDQLVPVQVPEIFTPVLHIKAFEAEDVDWLAQSTATETDADAEWRLQELLGMKAWIEHTAAKERREALELEQIADEAEMAKLDDALDLDDTDAADLEQTDVDEEWRLQETLGMQEWIRRTAENERRDALERDRIADAEDLAKLDEALALEEAEIVQWQTRLAEYHSKVAIDRREASRERKAWIRRTEETERREALEREQKVDEFLLLEQFELQLPTPPVDAPSLYDTEEYLLETLGLQEWIRRTAENERREALERERMVDELEMAKLDQLLLLEELEMPLPTPPDGSLSEFDAEWQLQERLGQQEWIRHTQQEERRQELERERKADAEEMQKLDAALRMEEMEFYEYSECELDVTDEWFQRLQFEVILWMCEVWDSLEEEPAVVWEEPEEEYVGPSEGWHDPEAWWE